MQAPTSKEIVDALKVFFNGGEFTYQDLFGVRDVSPTMCTAFFKVKSNSKDYSQKAKCDIIFLRDMGWFLNEIVIIHSDGNDQIWWYNLLRQI